MKCKTDILITKLDAKTGKNGDNYILVSVLDMESGDVFDLITKDLNALKELTPMTKRENFIINFKATKYGIKPEILDYGKETKF